MNWQILLATIASLGIGYSIGSMITYWRVEWRRQLAQETTSNWLAWRNQELEDLAERMLDEREQRAAR